MTADHDAVREHAIDAAHQLWKKKPGLPARLMMAAIVDEVTPLLTADRDAIRAEVERQSEEADAWKRAAEAEAQRKDPDVLKALVEQANRAEAERDEAEEELAEALADADDLAKRCSTMALAADATRARVADLEAEVERLASTCTCDTGPWSTGPEADCAVHGAIRAYNLSQTRVAYLEAEVARLRGGIPEPITLDKDFTLTDTEMERLRSAFTAGDGGAP